jgi:hypothetical protein
LNDVWIIDADRDFFREGGSRTCGSGYAVQPQDILGGFERFICRPDMASIWARISGVMWESGLP